MNIKSLLLGSAAAMVAVSGARAADAVVIPEPEMVEYVRVCDTYGTGFFYIPGTETCLKIGGYVRYEITPAKRYTGGAFVASVGGVNFFEDGVDEWGWTKNTRGQLEIDARSETELGTLRGFIAYQGNSNTILGANVALDAAYIELGGLHMGYSDNAFDGGIVGETDILGGAKVNRIAYTVNAGSFDATISIDDDNGGGAGGLPDFVPNVSANAGFSVGPVDARLYGAYDNNTDEFAVKGVLGADITSAGRLEVAAYYTSGMTYVLNGTATVGVNEATTGLLPVAYATGVPTWSEWSIQAAYQHQLTNRLALTGSVNYWNNVGHLTDLAIVDKANAWAVGAMIDYKIVEGFDMKATVTHTMPTVDLVGGPDDILDSYTTGFVRFQRTF